MARTTPRGARAVTTKTIVEIPDADCRQTFTRSCPSRPDRCRRLAGAHGPGRIHRRQQRYPADPQHLPEPRFPRRQRPVQARRVDPGFHPRRPVGLHRRHRRRRPRCPGHARRQAGFRGRTQRHRPPAGTRRWQYAGRIQPPGPDCQGQDRRDRAALRLAHPRDACGESQRQPHAAAGLRGRHRHLHRYRRPDPHRRPPGQGDRPRFDQLPGPAAEQQERPLRQRRRGRPPVLRRCGVCLQREPHRALLLRRAG